MSVARRSIVRLVLLLALCLAMFLPGLTGLPPVDRDESRFAQATRQMVESGNDMDIHYQDEVRYKKPIGIYWLQAAAVAVVGEGAASPIWVYRLPSILGAILAIVLLYLCGRRMAGEEVGFAAALLFMGCLILNTEARFAKTDAALLATVVGALGAFGATYVAAVDGRRIRALVPLAGWLAIGLGILIKGPITPLVAALAVATLVIADRGSGRVRPFLSALRPGLGIVLTVLVAAPWFIAIAVKTHGVFFQKSVGGDLIPKLLGGQESHGAPPGYYLLTFPVLAWPGGLAAALGAPWAWANRRLPWVRFALAWAVPGLILFELVPTKLPNYILPFYPALMLLGAGALVHLATPASTALGRAWRGLCIGLFVLVGLLLGGVAFGLPLYFHAGFMAAGAVALTAALLTVVGGYAALRCGQPERFPLVVAIGAACLYGAVIGGVLPRLNVLWPARSIAQVLADAKIGPDRPLASVGYSEPSLVFSTRTDIQLIDASKAARLIREDPRAVVLVEKRKRKAFDRAVGDLPLTEIGHVTGLNLSHGRLLDIDILVRGTQK